MTPYQELLEKIHNGKSPYDGFPASEWAGTWYDDPGAKREPLGAAASRADPGIIVEVGSFVGESAIWMAKFINPDTHAILCIDTWMGGIDHWQKVPEKLKFHFGRPSLYYQFIGNVIQRGAADKILPLSLDSRNAARLLRLLDIKPTMAYVDASHEEQDAYEDFCSYWELLKPGGIMVVDDLTGWFPGVVVAFSRFCHERNLDPKVIGEKGTAIKV